MSAADPVADLELLVRSRYGIVHVDTVESPHHYPDLMEEFGRGGK